MADYTVKKTPGTEVTNKYTLCAGGICSGEYKTSVPNSTELLTTFTKTTIKQDNTADIVLYYSNVPGVFQNAATSSDGGKTWGFAKNEINNQYILGDSARISLNRGALKTNTINASSASLDAAGVPQTIKQTIFPSVAPPGKPTPPAVDENGNPVLTEEQEKDIENFFTNDAVIPYGESYVRSTFKDYRYPEAINTNGQDYIQFTILKYGVRKVNIGGIGLQPRSELDKGTPLGTICLPIQPSISDQNRVNWNQEDINLIDLGAQTAAFTGVTGKTPIETLSNTIQSKVQDKKLMDSFGKAILPMLTQLATKSENNLLSRMSGAILNPNMELLFQGPTLRPFQFSFRMTPRDDKEATQVRSIIRAFKEASAVQQGIENLFLKAPYVFKIRYILGGSGGKDHPSINRIKICALQQMSVDYTPGQTFMTYNDSNATMTSYAMSLTFNELEPVYAGDYKDIKDTSHIGY